MYLRWRSGWILGVALFLLSLAPGARAAMLETLITPFTGDDVSVRILLEEVGGDIVFTVSVEDGVGDLRGVFFNVSDDDLLATLQVSGVDVTGFETGAVSDLGEGANLNGGGTPCPCDVGVLLGSPGIGKDDILETTFTLSDETLDLDLSLFYDQKIGVRVTSVGPDSDFREGSAKLGGVLPVPEPTTAFLVGIGLACLGLRRTRAPRTRPGELAGP